MNNNNKVAVIRTILAVLMVFVVFICYWNDVILFENTVILMLFGMFMAQK